MVSVACPTATLTLAAGNFVTGKASTAPVTLRSAAWLSTSARNDMETPALILPGFYQGSATAATRDSLNLRQNTHQNPGACTRNARQKCAHACEICHIRAAVWGRL